MPRKMLCLSVSFLVFLLSGFRGALVAQTLPTDNKEYVISANDTLEIVVFGEPDLSITTKVPVDGNINFPLLGSVKAAGLTVRELEREIFQLLEKDYLVSPQVSIFVKEYGKISVSVLGQVRMPGTYQVRDNFTFSQAVALVSGFTDAADTSNVKLVRLEGNGKRTYEINAEEVLKNIAADIPLKAEDTIIVEELGKFSIVGQVIRPGVYTLKKGLTVVEAISQAGGFTPIAAQNSTRVVRVTSGAKKVIPVPVASIIKSGDASRDVSLQEDDTIIVPESFF